ncbi:hypothetical protein H1S01_15060 [Heliobacterium chlorum]|uniref:Uncharacterized protein n=1 Tax=Heliobacterium chlorum TaxID=2698 RepID=A0ABR7T4U6_HELCL|nr:hypothetical protein [Heliobacterium chlorum]MBC9785803.1 hypothetical protein [Heliobacterium chlorum]
MTDQKLKEILHRYSVPEIDPAHLRQTIQLAQKELNRARIYGKITFWELLAGQIRYISPYIWIAQAALLVLVFSLLPHLSRIGDAQQTAMAVLSTSSPLLALVAVPELGKSLHYQMWEMEMACRFNLQKLILLRLILFGVADLIVITTLLLFSSTHSPVSLIHLGMYILVPFTMANSLYLFILRKVRGKAATAAALSAGIFLSLGFALLSRFSDAYAVTTLTGWFLLFFLSAWILTREISTLFTYFSEGEQLIWIRS